MVQACNVAVLLCNLRCASYCNMAAYDMMQDMLISGLTYQLVHILSANHLVLVELPGQDLQGWLNDPTP